MTGIIRHLEWCNDPERTESFRAERYGEDGMVLVARPRVDRCVQCGAQTVDGQPVS